MWNSIRSERNDSYSLLKTLRAQIVKDNTPERLIIFGNFVKKYGFDFILHRLEKKNRRSIKAAFIFLIAVIRSSHLVKFEDQCVYFLNWSEAERSTLTKWNQELQIARARNVSWSMSFSKILYAPIFLLENLLIIPRVLKLIFRLSARYPFLVSARATEALLTFLLFSKKVGSKKVHFVISSESNPHAIALMQLARIGRIKLSYIAHSPYIDNPRPVFFDLGVFWGSEIYRQLTDLGSTIKTHFLINPRTEFAFNGQKGSILICLSKTVHHASLLLFVRQISEMTWLRTYKIQIRPHPNAKNNFPSDLKPLICKDESLSQCLTSCLFVIAGNSTVHLDVLAYGIPSFYSSRVDDQQTVTLPFIRDGLIRPFEQLGSGTFADLEDSYTKSTIAAIKEKYFGSAPLTNYTKWQIRDEILKSLQSE